jgi:hypothetical protein
VQLPPGRTTRVLCMQKPECHHVLQAACQSAWLL